MKLIDQVCSLELSGKLKELGVKQVSLIHWVYLSNTKDEFCLWPHAFAVDEFRDNPIPIPRSEIRISAFSTAELAKMLPPNINEWGLCFDASSMATEHGIISLWHCTYADYDKKLMEEVSNTSLANCMAKMLIHLIEQGLVKVEDLK